MDVKRTRVSQEGGAHLLSHQEPRPMSSQEAESAFASGDAEVIASALVKVAFHDLEWRWAQDKCLGFADSDIAAVRRTAVTCLGHVARIHRKLDLERVLPVLDELALDPEVQVMDALDDIQMFVNVAARRE